MRFVVLAVGKLKENWQRQGCLEYQKRLSRYGGAEIVEAPDFPEPDKPSEALNQKVLAREGEYLLKKILPNDRVVALCIEGQELDSVGLSRLISSWSGDGRRLVFVIGGSLGLSKEVVSRADYRLSFSRMTFPHPLMRVILLEQLYRAAKIEAGERYHK